MLIVGLTGGIAAGKNSVAKILEDLGAFVIDADIVSRELVKSGSPAWNEIVAAFGDGILDGKGEIDRMKLGKIVFHARADREILNAILHPKIIAEEWERVSLIKQKEPSALIVINAALLIESGNYKDVDTVVVISANEETMILRMTMRDGLSREEAMSRLKAQMPVSEKKKYADYVIENDGALQDLKKNVRKLIITLLEDYKSKFKVRLDDV